MTLSDKKTFGRHVIRPSFRRLSRQSVTYSGDETKMSSYQPGMLTESHRSYHDKDTIPVKGGSQNSIDIYDFRREIRCSAEKERGS